MNVKEGDRINYIGESWAYDGEYTVITAESTYNNPDDVPEHEKGKLVIVHLTNSDFALFVFVDTLNPNDWELIE